MYPKDEHLRSLVGYMSCYSGQHLQHDGWLLQGAGEDLSALDSPEGGRYPLTWADI